MYTVKIMSHFSAAHSLRGYNGNCEDLHGHNWKVEVVASSRELNDLGMVMDFAVLKKITNNALRELDHHHLNELDYFSDKKSESEPQEEKHNPSSEEIARYVFIKLKEKISEQGCQLTQIRVWETENSCAIYRDKDCC